MIYPAPQSKNGCNKIKFGVFSVMINGKYSSYAKRFFDLWGINCSEKGNVKITLIEDCSREMTYIEQSRRVTDEKYKITVCSDCGVLNISVRFSCIRSLKYAVDYLASKLIGGSIETGEITDYPLFSMRGYIEGFYGKPWSFEERSRVLGIMSRKRMNTYYYAPKDDLFHREKWRESYPTDELEKLKKLVCECEENCIDFHYCIAPGLSMKYSSESDYLALLEKLKGIYSIGVRGFGLLLDDIPPELYHQEDKNRFGNETVNAHIYLANRLFDDLTAFDPAITLTLCPLEYHGKGNEYFISKLGCGIDSRIRLFWTGRNICSQEITVSEAVTFINSTRHLPLYWDNFPVNDAEMYNEMHLGYLSGRESELYRYSEGIISNCMEYAQCSLVPLMTVADFLWNPYEYNEVDSWHNAVKELTGDYYDSFILFADNLLSSCLKVENSPLMNKIIANAEQAFGAGEKEKAMSIISDYYTELRACCNLINSGSNVLFVELSRWAEKQTAACDLLEKAIAYVFNPDDAGHKHVRRMLDDYLKMPETLCDFSFTCLIERMLSL